MRLLLKIEYAQLLFAEGAPIAELLAAFDGVKVVEKDGYGVAARYIPKHDPVLGVELISDDAVSLPENADNGMLDKFHAVATERDELINKVHDLEEKLKAINEAAREE